MKARAAATLPAQDLERAKRWYQEKLGFTPFEGDDQLGFDYRLAGGTAFLLFRSTGKPSGTHTQMGLEVEDVEATVRELRGRGVRFEEYDLPGLKTVDGIATVAGEKTAWFKDSEGNLIGLGTPARVRAGQA
jgi:catechol 2,3-dioxygenase-like lactoylglutathione lyase family enzyme